MATALREVESRVPEEWSIRGNKHIQDLLTLAAEQRQKRLEVETNE